MSIRGRTVDVVKTESFVESGYALIPGVIAPDDRCTVIRHIEQFDLAGVGSRNLLALEWCRQLAYSLKVNSAFSAILPRQAVAVQCTLFEKSTHKNWGVAPHQDLSIPVRERTSVAGCTGWAQKEGVHYTQPPAEVLARLVAIRVHLDPCPAHAGPLRVIPGSHRRGRLSEEGIDRYLAEHDDFVCIANGGDALAMRPLLLHASSRATGNDPRRVLHFLFGPRDLPLGLHWNAAV